MTMPSATHPRLSSPRAFQQAEQSLLHQPPPALPPPAVPLRTGAGCQGGSGRSPGSNESVCGRGGGRGRACCRGRGRDAPAAFGGGAPKDELRQQDETAGKPAARFVALMHWLRQWCIGCSSAALVEAPVGPPD
eukprot:365111-Chlamydomonas_euryale.AAC.1